MDSYLLLLSKFDTPPRAAIPRFYLEYGRKFTRNR